MKTNNAGQQGKRRIIDSTRVSVREEQSRCKSAGDFPLERFNGQVDERPGGMKVKIPAG